MLGTLDASQNYTKCIFWSCVLKPFQRNAFHETSSCRGVGAVPSLFRMPKGQFYRCSKTSLECYLPLQIQMWVGQPSGYGEGGEHHQGIAHGERTQSLYSPLPPYSLHPSSSGPLVLWCSSDLEIFGSQCPGKRKCTVGLHYVQILNDVSYYPVACHFFIPMLQSASHATCVKTLKCFHTISALHVQNSCTQHNMGYRHTITRGRIDPQIPIWK
jgi:hypothetical protein